MLGTLPVMDSVQLIGPWIRHLIILCLLTCPSFLCDSNLTCSPGLEQYGVTIPQGDIFVKDGDELRIQCVLNMNHVDVQQKNASSLYFVRNETEVPPSLVRIVNDSTIELYDPAPTVSSSVYTCKFRPNDTDKYPHGVAICLNRVFVGFPPDKRPATNITCISYNWQNLTCNWTIPQNFIKTTYQITLYEHGKRSPFYKCPATTQQENSCTWNHSTDPMYRQAIETYNISLTGTNRFGKHTQYQVFNSWENVLPAKPDFKVLNKTSNSILIWWRVQYPLETFPPGLVHKVEYLPQWMSGDHWQTVDTSSLGLRSVNYTLNLTNLSYANSKYDIRVSIKSAKAKGDNLWSEPATDIVSTLPDVPSSPPITTLGSFEVNEHGHRNEKRDVYVYWQQIPHHSQNGDEFGYKVIEVKEGGVVSNKQPSRVEKAFAWYENLSNSDYEFTIVSSNRIGRSVESSKVSVPRKDMMPSEPGSFTKVAYENGTYELSWKAPDAVDNYTIFWCDDEKERPYQCKGMLRWKFIDSTVSVHNVTVNDTKNYQFAISANSKSGSSGMVWAICTIIHDKVMEKMKNIWTQKVGSTSIEVHWELDCSSRSGILKGFRIFYCLIGRPVTNQECTDPPYMDVENASSATLRNLKPYKTYSISVAVLTASGIGAVSDPIYRTTFEDAPDPPGQPRLIDHSNTSATIDWEPPPPEFQNGVIRHYEIHYNNRQKNTSFNETHDFLTGLQSFTNYTVTVSACTSSCSKPSKPMNFMTSVGAPGDVSVGKENASMSNGTDDIVYWEPPKIKGGKIDFYEVEIFVNGAKRNSTIVRHTSSIKVNCTGTPETLKIFVRAANKDGNMIFYGPQSLISTYQCRTNPGLTQSPGVPRALLWVLSFVILAAFLIIVFKKVWQRWAKMKDVDIKLPPTLNAICDEKSKEHGSSVPMQSWTSQSRKEENALKTESSSDAELLLQKKEMNGEHDEAVDAETKDEMLSEGESLSVSANDDHIMFKSTPIMNENYGDRKARADTANSKGNSSERDPTYCKVGGYVSIPPLLETSATPQPAPSVSDKPYVPNSLETNYVKAYGIPNQSQAYCRIGLGNSDNQAIPDAATKLLHSDTSYVTVGDGMKLNREQNSLPIQGMYSGKLRK